MAASWLRSHGFRILRQRFRYHSGGEVDLVCRDGDTLVFTEVKSSISTQGGAPARRVDRNKRELLRRGARQWLRLMGRNAMPYRFDIVEVFMQGGKPPQLRHQPAAFTMQEGAAWAAAHAE